MTIPRGYVPNHKFWDQMGRVTPNVEWSESHRPSFESAVAAWLPTVRFDRGRESYITISSGKVVAEDRQGCLVPAGLRKKFNAATSTAILVYTATDAAEGMIDLTTGQVLAGAASYTEDQVTAALKERGLIRPTERAMDFISKPVGIASYNYYKAAGTDTFNPATLFQHNFRPQANVAITCDYVITLPVLPAVATTETMDGAIASTIDFSIARTGGWFDAAALHGLVKYASTIAATDNVVGYLFENYPIAPITDESPITCSVAGLVRQRSSVTALSAAGDFFLDCDLGVLFVFEAGGNAIPSPFAINSTITYYHYQTAETPSASRVTSFACATGDLEFGDFLTYDANSNLIKASLDIGTAEGYDGSFALFSADPDYSSSGDAATSLQIEKAVQNFTFGIVGQVIGVMKFPRDYSAQIKTAYNGQSAANMRTPGSATGGRTDQLTYANAAEKMIIVNLILR